MLYRALVRLHKQSIGIIEPDSVFPESYLGEKVTHILLEQGKIAECSSPPLAIIAGWKIRSTKLAKVGIVNVDQFLEADDKTLQGALSASKDRIEAWKAELLQCLLAPTPQG